MIKEIFKGSAMLSPVPVVLVTSKSKEGKVNVFTVAWAGMACTHPPYITIAVRPSRLSYEYIMERNEFTINLPTVSMTKIVDFCGVRSGRNVNKIEKFNLKLNDSNKVSVPIIERCPINLECSLKQSIPLGTHDLLIAEILNVHVDKNLIDKKGKIHYEKANLITYCHGEYYELKDKNLGNFGFSVKKKKK